MPSSIVCFHLPDFPAWAFTRSARAMRPVVVVASGRVVAVNRLARRDGVTAGMATDRALALSPDATICPRDAGLEAAVWEEVLHELHTLTPFLEDAGPGWAFLRIADAAGLSDLTARLGGQAGRIEGQAGGPDGTRMLARLAALRAAPGRALPVDPRHADAFLARFPVAALDGLGFAPDDLERLRLFGYPTLGAAAALSLRQLRAQFGREGERLHALLHPPEEAPIAAFRPPPSVTAATHLDDPLREPGDLLPHLDRLVSKVATGLGPMHCRRITVRIETIRTEDRTSGGHLASRVLPEATQSEQTLRTAARAQLLPLLSADSEVVSMAVELGGLGGAATRQGVLFGERPSVYLAVRSVHRRFPGAIKRAVLALHALFDEDASRYEPFPDAAPARRTRSRVRS
jgi:nucleotidyltransferase/DNA polymerase involved in DNA repair